MRLEINLIEAKETEKSVRQQFMDLYAYDFSEFDDTDVNVHGYQLTSLPSSI